MSGTNGVMMQYFQWYLDPSLTLWEQVREQAPALAAAGFTAIWLPPAYKGMNGAQDVGYGVYDLYDLGEFAQKGSVRTKYGDHQQYLAAITALHAHGLHVYADVVLNHKMGGDGVETVRATPYSQHDRLRPRGDPREISVYTHFNFAPRQQKYSNFVWHWWHFDGVDWDAQRRDFSNIYLFEGKRFDDLVALENGNFAYLMGCDVDFQHPEVQAEMLHWGKWYLDTTGVDGLRLDAIKHISAWFFPQWLDALEKHAGRELFTVGEYWFNNLATLLWYIDVTGGRMAVFDVPLHYNFHNASRTGVHYDLRRILDNTLVRARPTHAVTFVDNHDSQPLQALESPVESWFKPLAYALILLRVEGYPCVFYADYYGAQYEDKGRDGKRYAITLWSERWWIDLFLQARHHYAHGPQYEYFDHPNCIGWTRLGDAHHPGGMAVLLSNGAMGRKWMEVGKPRQSFIDITGRIAETVTANEHGWAEFLCQANSVSVWTPA